MNSINAKPAAGLLGVYVGGLVIGVLKRYTSYDPSVEEATAIVGLCGFVLSWLIPERLLAVVVGKDEPKDDEGMI